MPDDDKETEAEKQRKGIVVNSSTTKTAEEEKIEKEEEIKAKTAETEDETKEETKEEEIETKEEEIEASEKTQEELEQEKLEAKTKAEKDRVQRRIDKEVAKSKRLEEENEELKRKLAAKPDDEKVLTEADVEKRAEVKAIEREFINTCNKLADDATKIDKDFKKNVDIATEDLGMIPGQMIGVLADMDKGAEVLAYLVKNVDELEDIYKLAQHPGKMALELSKVENKIIADAKKSKEKPISKVPAPTTPLGGKGGAADDTVLTGRESMDEFIRKRNIQVENRRKIKAQGLRP